MESVIDKKVPNLLVGDPVRLRQILVNLVGNSVKFTDKGGISISVKRGEGEGRGGKKLHFIVSDSGIGIPPEKLDTIFEDFTQADTSTTRTYGGTGLGLSISKKLVEIMGGEIWAESIRGKGSEFHFIIPYQLSKKKSLKTKRARELPSPTVRPLNILLAEDSEDNRLLVNMFLQETPHSLTIVEDGKKALKEYKKGKYDLVLMDMQMPIMDGYSATAQIREWEKENNKKTIPVIAFTAHALKDEVEKCIKAGCTSHLAKPLKKDDLLRILYEVTGS